MKKIPITWINGTYMKKLIQKYLLECINSGAKKTLILYKVKLIELGTASATPPLYVTIYNLCHILGILEGEHIGATTP